MLQVLYNSSMTDYHVHIGQYFEIYHQAQDVFAALKAAGFSEAWFSSTSSEIYCKTSPDVLCGKCSVPQEDLPSAKGLYDFLHDEMKCALQTAAEVEIKAHALCWIVPELYWENPDFYIEDAFSKVDYEGFKIHPWAQNWNLSDKKIYNLADRVFSYAENHGLKILIHTGESENDLPNLFEDFFARYPKAKVQLAHAKHLELTLKMLKKYPNLTCDSAFAPKENLEKIQQAGFANRILFGSDYPMNIFP